METSGSDARAIANHFLDLGDNLSIPLTNLHLQKVVFFAHGNYIRRFGRQLVLNRFEAWEHGPVVPELYHSLKVFGDARITGRATKYDFFEKRAVQVRQEFSDQTSEFLAEILRSYGRMDPWALVKLSHESGGAWDVTMKRAEQRANFAMVISPEVISACFGGPSGGTLQ